MSPAPSPSVTPTASQTPTDLPTASSTPTATDTPTASQTPSATAAPTPSESPTTTASTTAASTPATNPADANCGGVSLAKPGGGTWSCTFDDEFDGSTLDLAKWQIQLTSTSGFDTGGACYLADNVAVARGTLNLTVRKNAASIHCGTGAWAFDTHYTSGMVSTLDRFSQTYGRFEVRAKLPATTVKGLQETFWLWPNNALKYGAWPGSGEIDFAEFYSQYAGWNIPYLHYNYTATTDWATNTNVVTAWPAPYAQPGMNCQIDQSAYNTYAVQWLPGQITLQVNGQNCLIDNYVASGVSGAAPFDQPYFLALTQALGVGSNAPAANLPLPATTSVDYVRAWS